MLQRGAFQKIPACHSDVASPKIGGGAKFLILGE